MTTATQTEANAYKNKLVALEQQLEAVRRERAPTGASQQGLMTELRSKSAALEQQLEVSRQKDAEIVALKKRLEAVSHAAANNASFNNVNEMAQLRTANAELTLRLNESEAVQEQLQAMLRKTATQLKAAVSSVRSLRLAGAFRVLLTCMELPCVLLRRSAFVVIGTHMLTNAGRRKSRSGFRQRSMMRFDNCPWSAAITRNWRHRCGRTPAGDLDPAGYDRVWC